MKVRKTENIEMGIRKVTEQAAKIPGIIRMDIGESNFETPLNIREAAKKAIDSCALCYTPIEGLFEARKAVSKEESKKRINIGPENILITNGAMGALFNVIYGLFGNTKKEIILFNPHFSAYEIILKCAGVKWKTVSLWERSLNKNKQAKFTTEELISALNENTAAILLTNPDNPTGITYSEKQLKEISKIAKDNKLLVISDECYDLLTFEKRYISIAKIIPKQTIIVNSVSKTRSMTGWRIGWLIGEKKLISELAKLNHAHTSCCNIISQYALIEAMEGPKEHINIFREEYKERAEIIKTWLKKNNWEFFNPDAGLYVFAKTPFEDSTWFCKELMKQEKVCLVPGEFFGPDNESWVRFSFGAVDKKKINKALTKISRFLTNNPIKNIIKNN